MKTTLLILAASTALSQAATFVSLDITTLELSLTDTATSTALVIDAGAGTITTTYTLTSDYDGLGGDDTLSFDLVATFSGTDDGPQISSLTATNYVIEPGQTITFSLENISYTRAGGLPNSVILNGFYEISVGGDVVGDFTSITTGASYESLSGTGVFIDLEDYYPSFDLTLDENATGSKVFRRPDVNFSLETTIPEPTTTTLLGVGVLALLYRRHRK